MQKTSNPWLLRDSESFDAALAEARRRLEAIEADPESDELTLVMARHEIFRHKGRIAAQFAMMSGELPKSSCAASRASSGRASAS
jgi:hypothetical protein